MDEETIEVAPSEDNGNTPIEETEVTPSEPTVEETPASVEEMVVEPELYELPDGRKVDAETLSREWKENFYPDYTRKSQELAAVKAPITEIKPTNLLDDPNYVPTSYAELAQQIKLDTLREIQESEQAKVDARSAVETEVVNQLESIKKADPSVNENALFLHANKYGFRDLTLAHQNMKDMSETMKKVQKVTAENINKRNDPVSVSPGASGVRPEPSQFATSREYLNALKAGGK